LFDHFVAVSSEIESDYAWVFRLTTIFVLTEDMLSDWRY